MRTYTVAALLSLVLMLAAVAPAGAGELTQVRGTQRPATTTDGCGVGEGFYFMEGASGNGAAQLIGCWWTTSLEFILPSIGTLSGVIVATGTELFDGCLDLGGDGSCAGDPSGTLDFAFNATVKYDPGYTQLQQGRCYHPITGGTDDFEGATGALRFKDDPATGCSYYSGHLTLED